MLLCEWPAPELMWAVPTHVLLSLFVSVLYMELTDPVQNFISKMYFEIFISVSITA
jgi:hypothetical protein